MAGIGATRVQRDFHHAPWTDFDLFPRSAGVWFMAMRTSIELETILLIVRPEPR
jgi:hypothetical protein